MFDNEVNIGAGEVMHLGVRRPWRKKGLGTTLLQIALHEFYRRGIHIVRLNVDAQSLTNAHLLYERTGFRTVNAYMNYFREI
jgi:mycothiol synthase